MWSLKSVLSTVVVAAAMTAATPAFADVTTIATFGPIGTGTNIQWINSNGNAGTGTGGRIVSTAGGTTNGFAARNVSFSFLQPSLQTLSGITALFRLDATVSTGNPAESVEDQLYQNNIGGTFSFTSTEAYEVNGTTYATGSNLLSGTFSGATIFGRRGGRLANFSGTTVNYLSDFTNLTTNVTAGDFFMPLSSVAPGFEALPLAGTPDSALRNFRAVAGGTFSVDAVPEPASWAMMIVGFGLIGSAIRRRRAAPTVVYA